MKVALLGASRGCGLAALQLLLEHTSYDLFVLLRDPTSLDAHSFPTSRLHIFKGDALSPSSISAFLSLCGPDLGNIISSIGGKPIFNPWRPFSPLKFPSGQENICHDSMNVLLEALRARQGDDSGGNAKMPKLIVVSSNAIGHSTHEKLPWALKPLYGRLLKLAHADKERMEILLHRTFGWSSNDFNPVHPSQSSTLSISTFPPSDLCILRPSLLTDGESKGIEAIRASSISTHEGEDEYLTSAWTISRKDVGLFIVQRVLNVPMRRLSDEGQGSDNDKISFGRGIVISY